MNTKGIGDFLKERNERIKQRYSNLKKEKTRDEILEIISKEENLAPSTITNIVSRQDYCSKTVPKTISELIK